MARNSWKAIFLQPLMLRCTILPAARGARPELPFGSPGQSKCKLNLLSWKHPNALTVTGTGLSAVGWQELPVKVFCTSVSNVTQTWVCTRSIQGSVPTRRCYLDMYMLFWRRLLFCSVVILMEMISVKSLQKYVNFCLRVTIHVIITTQDIDILKLNVTDICSVYVNTHKAPRKCWEL